MVEGLPKLGQVITEPGSEGIAPSEMVSKAMKEFVDLHIDECRGMFIIGIPKDPNATKMYVAGVNVLNGDFPDMVRIMENVHRRVMMGRDLN